MFTAGRNGVCSTVERRITVRMGREKESRVVRIGKRVIVGMNNVRPWPISVEVFPPGAWQRPGGRITPGRSVRAPHLCYRAKVGPERASLKRLKNASQSPPATALRNGLTRSTQISVASGELWMIPITSEMKSFSGMALGALA